MGLERRFKSMRFMVKQVLVILAVGWLGLAVQAGELDTSVTRYSMDRLYFPVGEESHVYEHARFTIFHDTDSIYTGLIDHAWQGVSVSESTNGFFDTASLDACEVVIETAKIDSAAQVIIGTDIKDLVLLAGPEPGDRVKLERFARYEPMFDGFFHDALEGIITFQDLSPRAEAIVTTPLPLPYLVAMIPNVGEKSNYQGQLTTSLYYRSNRFLLSLNFDGDQIQMVNRWTIPRDQQGAEPGGRLYPYSPDRGRRLFLEMTYQPSRVAVYTGNRALDGLGHFFADIISRDRCPVELTSVPGAADIRLEFIPWSDSIPATTVYALYHQLVTDTVPGLAANEHVRHIAAELRFVESPLRPEDYYRHLAIAGRIMIEDLGVFPLFRPTLFLHSHKRLQNIQFDADGRLDFSEAILVHLPKPPKGKIE